MVVFNNSLAGDGARGISQKVKQNNGKQCAHSPAFVTAQ